MSLLANSPTFDLSHAERIARELFGATGSVSALTSERDQNFLVDGPEPIVVKIANATEQRALIEAQQRAMKQLERLSIAPRVVPSVKGKTIASVRAPDGRNHLVWAISKLPGLPLASASRRSPLLAWNLGATVGRLTSALTGFDDPAIHREFHWDLARGRGVIDEHRALIDDAALGATVDALIARFDDYTVPHLAALATSTIHNDLNDANILVGGGTLDDRNQHVVGVVDFGDMVHSYTIAELAVAAAYQMLDAPNPLATLAQMVRGYQTVRMLTDDEQHALWGLIMLRLCMSASIAAYQQRERPDNAYLGVSQQPLGRTLPRLARIPFAFAAAAIRGACDLEPIAKCGDVRAWLGANTHTFAPVLGVDLRTEPSLVLDLSAGSPLVSGDANKNAEPELTPRVFAAMRDAGAQVAIGRYDEPRLLYVAPFFEAGDGTLYERRTIHIGLDLFAPAGTPVYTPLDGVIHAFGEYLTPQDYGRSIVLRHATDDGTEFFTLYGHLSAASIADLTVGKPVHRGERIGALGTPEENVGWTPHLHLQVITDLLGAGADFAGVGTASHRHVWRSISPDPNLIVGVPSSRFPATTTTEQLLSRRTRHIGGNVSIAYRNPIHVVRGWKQYLYDDTGRRYIDAYNNVPHVGHSHPRVVDAVARQMSVLNTNTRYLYDGLAEYAERLTALFPDSLSVCYLLNSASEANELALRLARAYTNERDMIVLEGAYHGNTTSLIDVSPYKHAGPGGKGAPDWVHAVPVADDYRGEFHRDDRDAGPKFAQYVKRAIETVRGKGRGLAGFIAESCPSVGGQIIFPPGYLAYVYESVRLAGGVCIADEVQTGLGRIGTHMWAFEAQEVVPDIVVLGKPLGNGHPLAAVVTTREIADAFDNGMEFFSTFGGNTVSCAAGLAVLDVLREEKLQRHALTVGDRMLAALRPLSDKHELVGDVRGSGLFLGVELVRDHTTLEPAGEEASYVSNRMREEGILLGTDGPHHNVIKIRPPMPFDAGDADTLVDTLDRVIGELHN